MLLTTLAVLQAAKVMNAPIRLPGTHELFHRTCDAVEAKLEKGDWAGAYGAATALPAMKVKYSLDLKGIPVKSRSTAQSAIKEALERWKRTFPDIQWVLQSPPDIAFQFVPTLPAKSGESIPQGFVMFTSTDPKEPRVEALIAMKRGNPLEFTSSEDLFNAVNLAMSAYFGIGESSIPGRIGFASHQIGYRRNAMHSDEIALLRYNQTVVQTLRRSINQKIKIRPGKPDLQLDTKQVELAEVTQGAPLKFSFQVTNLGTSPLALRMAGDCACLQPDSRATVDAQATQLVHGVIDTRDVFGLMNQSILIWTNDPDRPYVELPIQFKIKPSVRMLMPQGGTRYPDTGDIEHDVFLSLGDGIELKPKQATTSGLNATVTYEPWIGKLADPDMREPESERRGYHFKVRIAQKDIPFGRFGVTLAVQTDHTLFSTVRTTFYVQTGIVAFPDALYMGRIARSTRSASVLLVRPGRPFKITKVESSFKGMTATVTKQRNQDEFRITVQLDGSQPAGQFAERVVITTDDPKQTQLVIPVGAVVE